MTDLNTFADYNTLADWEKELSYSAAVAEAQRANASLEQARLDRDAALDKAVTATEQRDRMVHELRMLKSSLQSDLADWAGSYLTVGEMDHDELSELMQNNGLKGLSRTFDVTVRVSYEFTVQVEAADEESAQDEVDNDIQSHLSDNIEVSYPDETEFEVSEA